MTTDARSDSDRSASDSDRSAPGAGRAGPTATPTDDERAVAAALTRMGLGDLAERMGVEVLEVDARRTVARMPVTGNTQPLGLLHGGASAVLAESIGSIASAMHAGPRRVALGLELNCTHHKAVRSGHVTGRTEPLSLGRTVASYAISITDDAGALVCSARLTCLLRDR